MAVTIHQEQKDALNFLQSHQVGVLATTDPNGDPYAAAIYYTVDKDLSIYFLTKTDTKKADNLRHLNHAMLVVYEAQSQTTVQVMGLAVEITDEDETNRLFSRIVYASLDTSGENIPPIAKLDEGDYVAYRLEPKQVRMAVFSHAEHGNYKALFKTIVPKNNNTHKPHKGDWNETSARVIKPNR